MLLRPMKADNKVNMKADNKVNKKQKSSNIQKNQPIKNKTQIIFKIQTNNELKHNFKFQRKSFMIDDQSIHQFINN